GGGLAGRHLGLRRPGKRTRTVLALCAFAAVLASFRTINGVEAGSALLIVMVALKVLEAGTHRDQVVLTIVAYFVVFAALIDQQSIFIGAYLLAFVFRSEERRVGKGCRSQWSW